MAAKGDRRSPETCLACADAEAGCYGAHSYPDDELCDECRDWLAEEAIADGRR